jgi:hypothetical protein
MLKIERLFGEANQNLRLSRARYRSRSKVQIQVYRSAIIQKLNRLVIAFYPWVIDRWLSRLSKTANTSD